MATEAHPRFEPLRDVHFDLRGAPLGGDEPGAEGEAPEAYRDAGGRLGP